MPKLIFFVALFFVGICHAQEVVVRGTITNESGEAIENVNILIAGTRVGTSTSSSGTFAIPWPEGVEQITLQFSHLSYLDNSVVLAAYEEPLQVVMINSQTILKGVEVQGAEAGGDMPSVQRIDPKRLDNLPVPFNDFNSILASMPGVVMNNELSSTYSVRGGSYDENMVLVNGIPVYRPFLVSNGQQEGLSFVNPQMTSEVTFSTGGWDASFGDKMSSVLNVQYKEPASFGGAAQLGLLGGFIQLEGASKDQRFTWLTGFRHKRAGYLLKTLETKGSYKPKFSDWQNYFNVKLGKENDAGRYKTNLGILASYARNRYQVVPESRETEFGTFNQALKFFVAFEGQEQLQYDTYQAGLNLEHYFAPTFKTNFIVSTVQSREREVKDVEAAYLLCELDKDINSNTFNECLVERGAGVNYDYSRNFLESALNSVELKNEISLINGGQIKFGVGVNSYNIDDDINEYTYVDSAEYTTSIRFIKSKNTVNHQVVHGHFSLKKRVGNGLVVTAGLRGVFWDISEEFVVEPKVQLAYMPLNWNRKMTFKAAAGTYHQAPVYREMRTPTGAVNRNIKMQKATHFILGMDRNLKIWDRDFKWFAEGYYKKIDNLIPYDVDNVRLRYYGDNLGTGQAYGIDTRLSGEFIKGAESWFSLSYLSAKEDVNFDEKGYIRRPTDQRVSMAIFFEDHMPNAPSLRVNVSAIIGTGLPFGPPGDPNNRNALNGELYRRVDIGFLKVFNMEKSKRIDQLMFGLEVLNILGVSNVISYSWIEDYRNNQYAVPNDLSARFLNAKLTAYF